MNDLEIPEAALDIMDVCIAIEEGLNDAAQIIVAAELRRLAGQYKAAGHDTVRIESLLGRADQLDPSEGPDDD